jgi:hypothetical protein
MFPSGSPPAQGRDEMLYTGEMPLDERPRGRRAFVALVLLGLQGCAPVAVTVDLAATPPVRRESPRPALPESRLRPLFGAGVAPALFAAAAKLELGMPVEEARRAAPELFGEAPHRPAGFADVEMRGESDLQGRLYALVLGLPRGSALGDAMALWGEPAKGYDHRAKSSVYWWFNPGAHLRARLEDDGDSAGTSRLVLSRYLPVAELLGVASEQLGFEKEPLLGMKSDHAAVVYLDQLAPEAPGPPTRRPASAAPDLCKSELLVLPPVEYDDTATSVRVQCGPQGVTSFEVTLHYQACFALRDDVRRLLRHKLGVPANKTDIMGRAVLEFSGLTRRVRLLDDEAWSELVIAVMPRSKAAP